MKKKLSTIFFDIDETLYATSEFAKIARVNSIYEMVKLGLNMDVDKAYLELLEVIKEFGSNYKDHYQKLLLRIPREYYKDVNPVVLIAKAVWAYHEAKNKYLKPYEDVVEVLRQLYRTGIIIGIISSGLEIKQAEKLIRLNLLELIHPKAIFITEQLGIAKSSFKLYSTACETMNLPPQECMYVGDNPINDIDPPNEIGMITVLNRRGGRYVNVAGKTEPVYVIRNMWELRDILREDYDIQL